MARNNLMAGVVVLELGQGIAGSILGKLMVDQGATVTKVAFEDALAGEPAHIRTAFLAWDLGKRALQVTTQADLAALLDAADIVIDQEWCAGRAAFTPLPGQIAHLERNPRGIYCALATGLPFAVDGLAVEDLEALACARAGMFDRNQGHGAAVYIDIATASISTAIQLALACAAALEERDRCGHGSAIRAELATAPAYVKGLAVLRTQSADGVDVHGHGGETLSGNYRAGDGRWLHFSGGSRHIHTRIYRALRELGVPEERIEAIVLPQGTATAAQWKDARRAVEEVLLTRSALDSEEFFSSRGVAGAVCRRPSEWPVHPQAAASGAVQEVEIAGLGRVYAAGAAVQTS
jgi:crotonobetainyl-CoA:carnitine CoA-transferase CaiB-like acyl-CoA transferase